MTLSHLAVRVNRFGYELLAICGNPPVQSNVKQ
jgi:hypothetical protein